MTCPTQIRLFAAVFVLATSAASAAPLTPPGNTQLRHDLQLLNDSGVINIPLTAWPISNGDIASALDGKSQGITAPAVSAALQRVRDHLRFEMEIDSPLVTFDLAVSENPRFIRSFEDTPRDEGEVGASFSWMGERFALHLAATGVSNPFDGDEIRPDGSYVGVALGNWMITAGWQDRWWGPSGDGSLILSTNARPTPGIAIQRNISEPFKTKWLSWMGPWTLTSFMTEMDDDRVIRNTLLFGVRGTFRPPKTGLEISISRTAQWCGDGRPCDLSTFGDLLIGNDNRGVNVNPEDEPGNQLGGFDLRWRLPKEVPVALYMQWIGEDGRGGGGAIGAWLRQVGIEHWGRIGNLSHRTHIEVSDTSCRQGGFGFSDAAPNCAYEHLVYKTGYRYGGRAVAHSLDGDGLSYSFGSTLIQSAGHSWNILLRYMEINRIGGPNPRHTLAASPQERVDIQVSHERVLSFGRIYAGLGFQRQDDLTSGISDSDASGFIQWSSH
jgi:hypothetical protein